MSGLTWSDLAPLESMYPCDPSGLEGFYLGGATLGGLLLMALAIQANAPRVVEREYWTSDLDGTPYYNCFCTGGCGAYLKARQAGVDEGTDYEWCGECLYR